MGISPARLVTALAVVLVCLGLVLVGQDGISLQTATGSINTDAWNLGDGHWSASARRRMFSDTTADSSGKESYALVIDAGSSGSRVHVYKLRWETGKKYPTVDLPDKKLKTKPGLSSFVGKEDEAGSSLKPLMEFAMEHIPAEYRSSAPVILSATAGLRMVSKESADKILDSCYNWLKGNTQFVIDRSKISVISGKDEGAFGWLSINFLMNRLRGMPESDKGTLGGIEMGGASAQVTFLRPSSSLSDASESTYSLHVGRDVYPLYTHSYLGFGQEEARRKVNELLKTEMVDPCFPKGYKKVETVSYEVYFGRKEGPVEGGGNFDMCKLHAKSLLDKDENKCLSRPCSFNGVHQPDVWGTGGNVILFENFFHTANNIQLPGMDQGISPAGLEAAGRKLCSSSWDEIMNKDASAAYPKIETGSEAKLCFSLAYLSAFLEDGLNMPKEVRAPIMGKVGGTDIEWALGKMVSDVMQQREDQRESGKEVQSRQESLKNDVEGSSLAVGEGESMHAAIAAAGRAQQAEIKYFSQEKVTLLVLFGSAIAIAIIVLRRTLKSSSTVGLKVRRGSPQSVYINSGTPQLQFA